MLLPFEMCHLLWHHNRTRFKELFDRDRILRFWEETISANEIWWQCHPLRAEITVAEDRSWYLPLQLFGDDACLKKSRVMKTLTWYPATYASLQSLRSRIPTYCIPKHWVVEKTESDLQTTLVWSMFMWMTGRFPQLDHVQEPFAPGTSRFRSGQGSQQIAGGHVGVYTGFAADQMWMAEHFRFSSSWLRLDVCNRCHARNEDGPLDFCQAIEFPARTHEDYMESDGARRSALTGMPGFHLATLRGEPMHAGPLGAMPDAVGSALVEHCSEGTFGCCEISGQWEVILQAQLDTAYGVFADWARSQAEHHTIRRFTRLGFSMKLKNKSFASSKGKAHNCMVLCRWLEHLCSDHLDGTEYSRLRWLAIWAWVEFYEVCQTAIDPDFLNPCELKRLDNATTVLMHSSKCLASINAAKGLARWKLRPKLHVLYHINRDAQSSSRNPRAWWTFKDEEFMGKLGRIAGATHAVSMCNRSLERWCIHCFSFMEPEC